jgi:predicted NAD/FAD-dependent oxidoreductase
MEDVLRGDNNRDHRRSSRWFYQTQNVAMIVNPNMGDSSGFILECGDWCNFDSV